MWSALAVPTDRLEPRMGKRVAAIMQQLGFRSMTVHDPEDQKKVRGWGRDGERQGGITDA